jgi:hypothetical protein
MSGRQSLARGWDWLFPHPIAKAIETRGLERAGGAGKLQGGIKMAHSDEDLPEKVCLVEKVFLAIWVTFLAVACVQFVATHYEIKRVASGQEVGR